MAIQTMVPLLESQLISMQEETDPVLAEQAIPAQLKILEGILKEDPSNIRLLDALAEGFCSYSFSFVEDDEPERASALYLRGKKYAEIALKLSGDWNWGGRRSEDFKKSLQNISPSALPSLFWLGQCWGGWLLLNLSDLSSFAALSKVEAVMTQAVVWDPGFHLAGPHLFLGGFYGGRSKMLGGRPEKAKYHFERSLELTERKFLLNHLIYAKTYAVQNQNRPLFEDLLNEILDAPDDLFPAQRLANAIAKKKAKLLLDSSDDLF